MLTQTTIRRAPAARAMAPGKAAVSPIGSRALAGSLDLMGAAMSYSRNSEIYGEGEPADYLYKVISGTVRTYKVLSDGRRQIGAFYLPGDMFGLEMDDAHAFSAEAITDCRVLVIKRTA